MDGQQQYADAMRAFETYYDRRYELFGAQWPTKKYAEHRSWNAFIKLAKTCNNAKRDIVKFVNCIMAHMPKNGEQVVPNDLNSKLAERLWVEHNKTREITAADKWANYTRNLLQIQAGTKQSDEAILTTPFNVVFPAWFRVLYPESLNDTLVLKWGEEALNELRNDRDLLRFLRAAMPAKMEALERKLGVIDGI